MSCLGKTSVAKDSSPTGALPSPSKTARCAGASMPIFRYTDPDGAVNQKKAVAGPQQQQGAWAGPHL